MKNQDNGGTRSGEERRQNSTSTFTPNRRSGRDRRMRLDRRSGIGRERQRSKGSVERRDFYRFKG